MDEVIKAGTAVQHRKEKTKSLSQQGYKKQ